ncbi:MAG TPA: cation:proton antiporter [Puia sp.]|nr:cation:proton antiporter [Puia sp.]
MKKGLLYYPLIIGVFAFLIWFVIDKGRLLTPNVNTVLHPELSVTRLPVSAAPSVAVVPDKPWTAILRNIQNPLSLLLFQIIVIFFVSKLFGRIITRIGQPAVVGETIAGLVLGPSLLGWIFPDLSGFIFPKGSLPNLQFLSQIGLIFFMFLIGVELDMEKLKNKAQSAVVISHASIVFPYFLGVCVAYGTYREFAPAHVSFLSFALFMGIAMSITAFPVLARILKERNLTTTPLGALALTCAAADDVTAWCILAAVIAIVKAGNITSALVTISLTLLFVLVMLYGVRPLIKKVMNKITENEQLNAVVVTVAFFVLLVSAWLAEIIGIHALFGAFLAGAIMPKSWKFKELLAGKTEDISVLVLLPLFFAFTGLRTQIGLLNAHLWAVCAGIIFIAVAGKFGGSTVAARITGQSWKDSFSIGALMNTRGLMELIVLNIGYDLGILSPQIFAIMVLMALITTMMTNPLLNLVEFLAKKRILKYGEPYKY